MGDTANVTAEASQWSEYDLAIVRLWLTAITAAIVAGIGIFNAHTNHLKRKQDLFETRYNLYKNLIDAGYCAHEISEKFKFLHETPPDSSGKLERSEVLYDFAEQIGKISALIRESSFVFGDDEASQLYEKLEISKIKSGEHLKLGKGEMDPLRFQAHRLDEIHRILAPKMRLR
ncbi:hypothetical protein [Rhodovulum sp. DZ06]|uniref:hypothetical protein n=1 Tax=Rhodovulum sp. DZ06 TaxID=3425126 RepID=UPI003D3528FF